MMKAKPDHPDPVIDEIRAVRHRISQECRHEPARLVARYAEMQRRYEGKVVDLSGDAQSGEAPAA